MARKNNNMDRNTLRAATHLALEKSPIGLAEMRELILRHLLSDPDNNEKQYLTTLLFETYMHMLRQSFPTWDRKPASASPILVPGAAENDNIIDFYTKSYTEGFKYGKRERGEPYYTQESTSATPSLPKILPLDMLYYPKEIVEQFATTLGYINAHEKSSKHG